MSSGSGPRADHFCSSHFATASRSVAASAQVTPTVDDPSGRVIRTLVPPGNPIDVPPGSAGLLPPSAMPPVPGFIYREGLQGSVIVDASGRLSTRSGRHIARKSLSGGATSPLTSAVIDSMTTSWSHSGFSLMPSIALFGPADTYYLSDGTSWSSGAGSFRVASATLATPLRRAITQGDLPGRVTDLAVDDRYLWVATEGGLVRLALDLVGR